MDRKNEVGQYLDNISLLLLGILFLSFPLLFTTITTDPYTLPKQILLGLAAIITLVLFGTKMISERKVKLRRTPFDFPLFLFTIAVFLSSLFAVNRFDSLITFVPLFFAILSYFMITNFVKKASSIVFLLSALTIGAVLLSALSILSFFRIYVLPFAFTHVKTFTPLGSLLDQALYLGIVLFAIFFFVRKLLKVKSIKEVHKDQALFTVSFLIILAGFAVSAYQLLRLNPLNGGLLLRPFETGIQTGLAAISQDAGRLFQSLLFGSGFGTYAVDFAKYKLAIFNQNASLWSFTFYKSSSFVLDLLATTGVLGLLTYLYFAFRVLNFKKLKEKVGTNPIYPGLVIAVILSFVLPFSFIIHVLFFLLLGLFAAIEGEENANEYYDINLHFVASKNSLFHLSATSSESGENASLTKFLPVSFFITFTLFSVLIGFFAVRYIASDILFQNSLVAYNSNNALGTYNNQINAISFFPYRDVYYRVYSQTNLTLANTLAAQQSGTGSPSAQVQQTIYTLIQQSIKAGQSAIAASPQTVSNWQNLSSIYRSLIGFGQNAENFALASAQQSILLDPNNPSEYINLGGIYYQLQQWDNAQRQFQIAITLKPDFANAYYNLGHTLENKGDLQGAIGQYQTVKTLTAGNADALKKINGEIDALQQKIDAQNQTIEKQNQAAKAASAKTSTVKKSQTVQPPLNLNTPSTQLPSQKPQVEIPAPTNATGAAK